MTELKHRYDFVFLFDVTNGNPNGDPDAGNAPRIDPETGHGLVSDVCLKRKIRNYICLAKSSNGQPEPGYDIYVKVKEVLNQQHQRAYEALALKQDVKGKKKAGVTSQARNWMCQTFFDVRMFGAVMSTGDHACGQVRGPVQMTFARSIDLIVSLEQSITRMAVTTEEKAKEQIEKYGEVQTEMGRKQIVPYGLYRTHGFISPFLAADTGFSQEDLSLLWEALKMMFEHDHSAARGEMVARKLVVFEHESMLGSARSHELFERVKVEPAAGRDPSQPPRQFEHYTVVVDKTGLPDGVKAHEML